jgi:hypothetical protein
VKKEFGLGKNIFSADITPGTGLFPVKQEKLFNQKPTTEQKSELTAPGLFNINIKPIENKPLGTFSNEKNLHDLNEIEEQFKNDIRSVTVNQKPSSSLFPDKIETNLKEDSKNESIKEKNIQRLNSLNQFEKNFKKLSYLRFFAFLKKAQTLSHYYDMKVKNFRHIKKMKIFKLIKRYVENVLLNRYYIRELIKMKLDKISINNFLSHDAVYIDKKKFFNYVDLRNMLIHKFIEENKNSISLEQNKNTINHLKINIYTQKNLLYSTSILQNLFNLDKNEIEENQIEIEEGKCFINISEKNRLEPNTQKYFSIFINIVLIDQLDIDEIPRFIKENLRSIDKFSLGLIFIDYSNCELIEKIMTILDYANMKIKKEFHLIKYFKMNKLTAEDLDNISEIMKQFKSNYSIINTQDDYFFFPKADFTSYYSDLVEYYNNREFFTLFENEIKIQKLNVYVISVEEYLKKTKLIPLLLKQYSKRKLFLNSVSGYELSDPTWIKFFLDVNIILNFIIVRNYS